MRLPIKLVAGDDLTTDIAGSDFMLQGTEAMTGNLTGPDGILSETGMLPPAGGSVRERPEVVTFLCDEVIMSANPTDLLTFTRERTGQRQ